MTRRHSLPITNHVLEEYMQIIADAFTLNWLERNSDNPIQLLWKRPDELATSELYALACSLKQLLAIDPRWTKEQIKSAKSHTKNTYQGALFELFALAILDSAEHPIKPTKLNQEGYDGIWQGAQEQEIRVSVKSYGTSQSQEGFERKAKEVESIILTLLKKYNYPPSHVLLDFADVYPEKREWDLLLAQLDHSFQQQRNAAEPFTVFAEQIDPQQPLTPENARTICTLIIYPFPNYARRFYLGYTSYTLIITAAYHKNEEKNLYSKLEAACANLAKHSALENDSIINAIFIHIPTAVSLEKCAEWLDHYFALFPEKPISMLFLYQPAVVADASINWTGIVNSFRVYSRRQPALTGSYNITFPVGRFSDSSSQTVLVAAHPNGQQTQLTFTDKYVYQHGEHFHRMVPDGQGGYTGSMRELAAGVRVNMVIEIPGQPGSVAIQGRFPSSHALSIL